MKLKNITKEDAKIYIEKFWEQTSRKKADQILMKYLRENGVDKFSTPYEASWEITAACNLRCKHCCFAGQDYNSDYDISHQTAIDFAQELIDGDIVRVMLTGGEPLLREDLFDIIELFKKNNVAIELTTNAMLINSDNARKLGELFNPLCDYVQVSLDGADEETHDKTRGKGSFKETLKGIKLLIANGVFITINCVITSINMYQMCELYNLANDLGVNLITFSKIFKENDNKNLLPNNNLLFAETIKLILNEKPNLPIDLRLFSLPEIATSPAIIQAFSAFDNFKIKNFNCNKNEKIHIRKDGEVFLCLYSANKDVCSLGNIKENSLADIIENMKDNPLFQERLIVNSKCNNCVMQFYCKAGCPVNAYLKTGNINSADPICLL